MPRVQPREILRCTLCSILIQRTFGTMCPCCYVRRLVPAPLPVPPPEPVREDVIIIDSISTKAKPERKTPRKAPARKRKAKKKDERPTAWDRVLNPVLKA
jgi:hypothetical protein